MSHTSILPTLKDIPNVEDVKDLLIDQAESVWGHIRPCRNYHTLKDDNSFVVMEIDDVYCKVFFWFNDKTGSTHLIESQPLCWEKRGENA